MQVKADPDVKLLFLLSWDIMIYLNVPYCINEYSYESDYILQQLVYVM